MLVDDNDIFVKTGAGAPTPRIPKQERDLAGSSSLMPVYNAACR